MIPVFKLTNCSDLFEQWKKFDPEGEVSSLFQNDMTITNAEGEAWCKRADQFQIRWIEDQRTLLRELTDLLVKSVERITASSRYEGEE